jgi:hypothetical protein
MEVLRENNSRERATENTENTEDTEKEVLATD